MGEIDNSTKPTMLDNVNELGHNMSEVGNHLLKAAGNWVSIAWQEKQMEADAAIAAGKFIAEHPTEAVVTATTGPGGLAAMKVGQKIYAENEKDLAPVVDAASKAGQALYNEASTLAMDSSQRLRTNATEKPVTTVAELLINPVLPLFHSVVSAVARPEARTPAS
ncbi:MAG: hypothetical protein HYX67_01000 [Candidatus Melainabacteria bacterium]|nr:hypothetical protein [Candidatus Melainabacteria bacterium]